MKRPKGESHSECPCCALQAPSGSMKVWRRSKLCRQLVTAQQRASPPEPSAEEWISGLYRYYYVTHEHRVCTACYAHLSEGGQFHGGLRNRSKLAFVMMLAILALLIACLPILLPHLRSALWLTR
jgi:hypothetical protein